MNKLALAILLAATAAHAEPSPFGTSPYVVAYNPPPVVDTSHRGLTLEFALGAAGTAEVRSGAVTFAVGGWLNHNLSLAFRATAMGDFTLVGASAQYTVMPKLWLGVGGGAMRERFKSASMPDASGGGGFVRAGYDLIEHGSHALYVSGEVQVGSVGNDVPVLASIVLGYQFL